MRIISERVVGPSVATFIKASAASGSNMKERIRQQAKTAIKGGRKAPFGEISPSRKCIVDVSDSEN